MCYNGTVILFVCSMYLVIPTPLFLPRRFYCDDLRNPISPQWGANTSGSLDRVVIAT